MSKAFLWHPGRRSQSGVAAIEFALVFPLLLAVTYGAIVYGYVFVLQQSVDFAAEQGAQFAVATVPTASVSGTQTAQLTNATAVAIAALDWLPSNQISRVSVPTNPSACYPAGASAPASSITVEVVFNLSGLFPVLTNLPMGIGTFPPLPTTLYACAVAYV